MLPFVKRVFGSFLNDELAFKRWSRAILITTAASGVGFADQMADTFNAPGAAKAVKLFAIFCGFLGGAITAGEKNK